MVRIGGQPETTVHYTVAEPATRGPIVCGGGFPNRRRAEHSSHLNPSSECDRPVHSKELFQEAANNPLLTRQALYELGTQILRSEPLIETKLIDTAPP
jgi:hypothetical protein